MLMVCMTIIEFSFLLAALTAIIITNQKYILIFFLLDPYAKKSDLTTIY